jgi:hypothetical protein
LLRAAIAHMIIRLLDLPLPLSFQGAVEFSFFMKIFFVIDYISFKSRRFQKSMLTKVNAFKSHRFKK